MKVVVSAAELLKTLKYLKKFQDRKVPHIKISADPLTGTLSLEVQTLATLRVTQSIAKIPASVDTRIESKGDFSFTVDLPSLQDAVESFNKDEAIDIVFEGFSSVEIKSIASGCSVEIPAFDSTETESERLFEFSPSLPPVVFSIGTSEFHNAVVSTEIAASLDECKMILTGINFSPNGGAMKITAVDGHRMSILSTPFKGGDSFDGQSFTLPARILKNMLGAMKPKNSGEGGVSISVHKKGSWVDVEFSNYFHRILQVPGTPPNYSQLIPNSFERSFKLDKKEFLKSLEGAAKVAAKSVSNAVKLKFQDGQVEMESSDGETNTFRKTLAVSCSSPEETFRIAFNATYILDALKKTPLKGENTLTLRANGPTNPAIFKPNDQGDSFTYLVMPIQIRN